MVRVVGIEPTLLAEPDFESGASTSSTTPAHDCQCSLTWSKNGQRGGIYRLNETRSIALKLLDRLYFQVKPRSRRDRRFGLNKALTRQSKRPFQSCLERRALSWVDKASSKLLSLRIVLSKNLIRSLGRCLEQNPD